MIASTTRQCIPEPFITKMALDDIRAMPVVSIKLAHDLRRARRECQVYFLGPAGGGTEGGGAPVALVATGRH